MNENNKQSSSLGNILSVINLLKQNLNDSQEIITPLSRKKYVIQSLKGKDEYEFKSKINIQTQQYNFLRTFYDFIYSHINFNQENIESFETFLKSNTIYDVQEIAHVINILTYQQYQTDMKLLCVECNETFNVEKINYSDYKNVSKIWDNPEPAVSYTFNYSISLGNDLKLSFGLKIPTLYEFLQILTLLNRNKQSNALIPTIEHFSTSLMESNLYLIKSINVVSEQNGVDQTITNFYEIKSIIEELPLDVHKKVMDYYTEKLKNYIPVYKYIIKCPKCGNNIELTYDPESELLSRLIY